MLQKPDKKKKIKYQVKAPSSIRSPLQNELAASNMRNESRENDGVRQVNAEVRRVGNYQRE
jgi:hypothetical protein